MLYPDFQICHCFYFSYYNHNKGNWTPIKNEEKIGNYNNSGFLNNGLLIKKKKANMFL